MPHGTRDMAKRRKAKSKSRRGRMFIREKKFSNFRGPLPWREKKEERGELFQVGAAAPQLSSRLSLLSGLGRKGCIGG